jgi:serine/threonine-protein phosphatase 2A regulatory subunit B'
MVYNALKLFMEVNPQLFDDCSHEYSEQQNALAEKQSARQQRWDKLEQLAKVNKDQNPNQSQSEASASVNENQSREEGDPLENQRRMEALRLQDDHRAASSAVRE